MSNKINAKVIFYVLKCSLGFSHKLSHAKNTLHLKLKFCLFFLQQKTVQIPMRFT